MYTGDCRTRVYKRLTVLHVYTGDYLARVYRRLSDTCVGGTECITYIYRRQAILRLHTGIPKRNRLSLCVARLNEAVETFCFL
jgi:hypothetical protein